MPAIKSSSDKMLNSRFELYSALKEGMDEVSDQKTRPFSDTITKIRGRRQSFDQSQKTNRQPL